MAARGTSGASPDPPLPKEQGSAAARGTPGAWQADGGGWESPPDAGGRVSGSTPCVAPAIPAGLELGRGQDIFPKQAAVPACRSDLQTASTGREGSWSAPQPKRSHRERIFLLGPRRALSKARLYRQSKR